MQTHIIRHILRTGWNKAGQTIKLGNFGESSYNSKEVREAFNILEKAFILHLVYPVTAMHTPVLPALKRAPKLMCLDTGLVNFAANIQTEVLHDRTLMDTWQGAIAEHIVAQQLQVFQYEKLFQPVCRIRYSMLNLKQDGNLINIPLFLSDKTKELLKDKS